ncbi:MAG: reverse transcriptase domain-containing protein [Caldisericia bacterium]
MKISEIKSKLINEFHLAAVAVSFLSFTETIGLFLLKTAAVGENAFHDAWRDIWSSKSGFRKICDAIYNNPNAGYLYMRIVDTERFAAMAKSSPDIAYVEKYYKSLKQWESRAIKKIEEIASVLPIEELENTQISYRKISIPKKAGGFRELTIPNDGLKVVQKKILNLLYESRFCSIYAHGFQPSKSAYTNAVQHNKAAKLLKVDIKDAFPSTSVKTLSPILADILGDYGRDLVIKYCTYNNGLPQGAPTSGWLLNIALSKFDAYVNYVCEGIGLMYTRYADDICISANAAGIKKFSAKKMYALIKTKLKSFGYRINGKKTKMVQLPRKVSVTGYVLNSGKPTISRKTRRVYRAMLHNHQTGKSILPAAKINGILGYVKTAHPESVEKWTGKYLSK